MNMNDQYELKCDAVWLPHIFEMICQCVWSDGGDGDADIVSDNYKELAEDFDIWRKDIKVARDYTRYDTPNSILFTDRSNENISFCLPECKTPEWGYRFTIKKI